MKTTSVTRIDLDLETDVKPALALYNEDMMTELIAVFFSDAQSEHRPRLLTRRDLARFATFILNETNLVALQAKAGVEVVKVPDRMADWRKLVTEMPMLFIPIELLDKVPAEQLQVTLNGVHLDAHELLFNY